MKKIKFCLSLLLLTTAILLFSSCTAKPVSEVLDPFQWADEVKTGETEKEPLVFFHGNTVALPGDIVTVTGEYLDCFSSVVIGDQTLELIQPDRNSLKFELPAELEKQAYEVILVGDGIKRGIVLNAPKVVWIQGDEGEYATPGGWLRINGECLSIDGENITLQLIGKNGSVTTLKASDVKDAFSVEFLLPDNLAHGTYSLRFSNGYALSEAWDITVDAPVRASWPTDVFNILDFGGKRNDSGFDNSDALRAAITAAAENGGGVIYFPKGFYQMTRGDFIFPENTVLKGDGMGLTNIHWGSYEQGGSGWSTSNLPTAIFWARGNCAFEDITFAGAMMPTFLDADSLMPIDQYDQYFNNIYVKNCRFYAHMLAEANGFPMDQTDAEQYTEAQINEHRTAHQLFRLRAQNIQITDCDIQWNGFVLGNGYIAGLGYNKNLLMRNNQIISSECHTMCSGAIVEDNQCLAEDIMFGINGENVYYARNYMLEGAATMDRELMTSDWNSVSKYAGPITFHDDTHVSFPEEVNLVSTALTLREQYFRQRLCVLIVDGTGVGQYRFVSEHDGHILTLESPFDVYDETSKFYVTRMNAHWYIVDNFFGHASDVAFYVSQMDSVVAGNETEFVWGFAIWANELYAGYQCDWYITYEDNYLHDGAYQHTFNADTTRLCVIIDAPITTMIGTTFRRNHFTDMANLQIVCSAKEAAFGFVLQDNLFEKALNRAIYFSSEAPRNTLLKGNQYIDCLNEILYPSRDQTGLLELD